MQNIINKLASAIQAQNFVQADHATTQLMSITRYPSTTYEMALHLKGDLKKIRDTRKPISSGMLWRIKVEQEKLVQYIHHHSQQEA